MLVACAGLLLRACIACRRVDPGYRDDRILSAEVFGNFTGYPTAEACLGLYQPLLDRLRRSPGDLGRGEQRRAARVNRTVAQPRRHRGRRQGGRGTPARHSVAVVSPTYFETLLGSRWSTAGRSRPPTRGRPRLSPSSAARWSGTWGRRSPLGARVSVDGGERWITVVGVVGDVRQYGLERDALAQVYLPLPQTLCRSAVASWCRRPGNPQAMAAVIRNAVLSLDPNMPIENVRTLEELRSRYLATPGHGAAAQRLRCPRAARVPRQARRRDRDVGVATHARVRAPHGARRGARPAARRHPAPGHLARGARPRRDWSRPASAGRAQRVPDHAPPIPPRWRGLPARCCWRASSRASGRHGAQHTWIRCWRCGQTEHRSVVAVPIGPADRIAQACPTLRDRRLSLRAGTPAAVRRIARVRSHSPPGRSRLHKKHITIAGWVVPAHMNGRYTPSSAGEASGSCSSDQLDTPSPRPHITTPARSLERTQFIGSPAANARGPCA